MTKMSTSHLVTMERDNGTGPVLGYGKVPLTPSYSLSKVMLVDHVDFNLLSISQFCKMGYDCLFNECGVTVYKRSDGSVAFKGVLKGKLLCCGLLYG